MVTAVTYNGTDARLFKYCKDKFSTHFVHNYKSSAYSEDADNYKIQRFKIIEKYADLIYAVNPDLLHYLPKNAKFLPYSCVDPHHLKPTYKNNGNDFILYMLRPTET